MTRFFSFILEHILSRSCSKPMYLIYCCSYVCTAVQGSCRKVSPGVYTKQPGGWLCWWFFSTRFASIRLCLQSVQSYPGSGSGFLRGRQKKKVVTSMESVQSQFRPKLRKKINSNAALMLVVRFLNALDQLDCGPVLSNITFLNRCVQFANRLPRLKILERLLNLAAQFVQHDLQIAHIGKK